MKKHFVILVGASLLLASVSPATAEVLPRPAPTGNIRAVQITMDDVVRKVSNENYNVYANALRVYQARENIQFARMNLLPKLNLWRVAGVAVEAAMGNYSSAVGLIGDIAPFLVPANWFRLEASKILYNAEKEGYRALWANELMTAKALYVHLLLDQSLFDHIKQSEQELKDLLVIVESREMLGGAAQGASRDIEIRLLALQEDIRQLEVLIGEEESLLSYMMGFEASTVVKPALIAMPRFEAMKPLDYEDFVFRAVDSSPEIRQFDSFIAASDSVRKEVVYSFLGTSSMSRGVAGGIFDNIPIQDGIGFGAPASMRIVSAQKEILKTQRKGIEETLKRHLRLLVNQYNLDLESYANLKRRVELTVATNEQLYERLSLGQDVDMLDLIEGSRNHIQADTAFFAIKYRFITNEDKLARLIFHGDYTKQPIMIESLKKKTTVNGRSGS
jgi:outer membrane protein TolC